MSRWGTVEGIHYIYPSDSISLFVNISHYANMSSIRWHQGTNLLMRIHLDNSEVAKPNRCCVGQPCFTNIIILYPLVSWPEQEIVWQNSKNPGLHALWFISACLSVFCGLLLPISQVFLSCQLVRIENFSPLLKTHITTTNPSFYNSNNFVHS